MDQIPPTGVHDPSADPGGSWRAQEEPEQSETDCHHAYNHTSAVELIQCIGEQLGLWPELEGG